MNDFFYNNKCAWITVNRYCNLDCFWCYAQVVKQVESNMPKDLLFKIIDICAEGGIKKIVFIGGEPTLYPFLFDAILYCKHKSIRSEITTNGLKLSNRHFVSLLAKAGLDSVIISMKGSHREDYIQTTGHDGFDSIMLALDILSYYKINYGLSAVLTSSLIEHLEILISKLKKHNVELLVFSFLTEFGYDEKSMLFYRQNAPDIVLKLLFDKINNNIISFEGIQWFIETCCHVMIQNSDIGLFFRDHFHCSCKKQGRPSLSFDTEGRILCCNNYPTISMGKYADDFMTFGELQRYARLKYK